MKLKKPFASSLPLPGALAGALLCALAIFATSSVAVVPGDIAPSITATDISGQPFDLAKLRGKVVYIDFWASWCAPCRRSFPWMNAMQEKYGTQGLTVVGVNVDAKRANADRFLAQVPARFVVAYDAQGATPKAYAVKGMPSSLLVDGQGKVLMVHEGFRDEDRDMLEATIRAALP